MKKEVGGEHMDLEASLEQQMEMKSFVAGPVPTVPLVKLRDFVGPPDEVGLKVDVWRFNLAFAS